MDNSNVIEDSFVKNRSIQLFVILKKLFVSTKRKDSHWEFSYIMPGSLKWWRAQKNGSILRDHGIPIKIQNNKLYGKYL